MDQSSYQPQPQAVSEDNVRRSLREVWTRLEQLLITIPDNIDEIALTTDQVELIENIESIEAEWILNPQTRAELSVIQWNYEGDED